METKIDKVITPIITATVASSSAYYIFVQFNWPNATEALIIMFVFTFVQTWGKKEVL